LTDKLERIVPAALVVALFAAAAGLVVQLRHVGDSSGEPRAFAPLEGDTIGPASFGPRESESPSPPAPSPSPDPEERLEAVPVELCAFEAVIDSAPLDSSATSVRAQIDAIARRVEELRGLTFRKDVEPAFQDATRMAEDLARRITRGYTRVSADRDERILEALGAIPRGTDLRRVVANAVSGDVLGYYKEGS
jgi:hypothetical protein